MVSTTVSHPPPNQQQKQVPNSRNMKMTFFVLVALVAAAVAETSYPAVYPATYEKPSYNYAPQAYAYSYAVKDEPSYNDFSHSESSDGKVVTGSYSVALPDGRTQIVTYKADSYGYTADVKYIGEAKYPEYNPVTYTSDYKTPVYTAVYSEDPTY